MARFRFYLLTAVFCTVIVFGRSEKITTPKPSTVPITQTTNSASSEAITNTSTVITIPTEPNTTPKTIPTEPSTSPKTIPTDPSTSPKTTPTEPTTPPKTTSTEAPTTVPSTTSTVVPVTTTPAPGPVPPPQQGTWSYSEKDSNISCIVVQFAAQLNVTYPGMGNNSELNHTILNVPFDANVTEGHCGNETQMLTISWPLNNETTATNNLTLFYITNSTTKTYALQHLTVSLSKFIFPNATSNVELRTNSSEWQTPVATSYRCVPDTPLVMSSENNVVGTLTVSRLQEEAFRTATGKGFSAARECGGGDVPDAVPIAVGCALGALVLIVLVAYLVARRRSAARGYLSM